MFYPSPCPAFFCLNLYHGRAAAMARDTAGLTPAMTFDFLPKRLRRFGTQNRMKIMLVLIRGFRGPHARAKHTKS